MTTEDAEIVKLIEDLTLTAQECDASPARYEFEAVTALMLRAASCIESLMRGEFICSKCGIRKDAESSPADF